MKVIIDIDPVEEYCSDCLLAGICQKYQRHQRKFYDRTFRENHARMVAEGRFEELKKTEPHPFCDGCMIEGVVTIEDGKLVVMTGNKVSVLTK